MISIPLLFIFYFYSMSITSVSKKSQVNFFAQIASHITIQDLPLISNKFLELAEDIQDYYWTQTEGKNKDRSDYEDESLLSKTLS